MTDDSSDQVRAAVPSPRPKDSGGESLDLRLVTHLYRQGLTALQLNILAVAVAVVVLWPVIDTVTLLAWAVWLVCLTLARFVHARRFLRRSGVVEDAALWEWSFNAGAMLGGASWGLAIFLFDFRWDVNHQFFLVSLLAGIGAASVSAYAASIRTYTLFLVCLFAPVFFRFLLEDGAIAYPMALLTILYAASLVLIGIHSNRHVVSNLNLRIDNEQLIEDLSRINEDLSSEVVQRRTVETELRRERQLFVGGPVVVFRCNAIPGWPVEYLSPNATQFGLDSERIMRERTPFAHLVHPQDLPRMGPLPLLPVPDGRHRFVERDFRIMLPSGDVRWIYTHTVPAVEATGRVSHLDGYIIDITDRKRAEQSLEEEKERAQVTLHSIADGVITTDTAHRVTYLNPVAETLTGVALGSARGRPLSEVFHAMDQMTGDPIDDPVDTWNKRRDVTEKMSYVTLQGHNGKKYDVTYSVAPIRDDSGNEIGLVVVLHDATRTLSLARELAYHASHDPLTGVFNRREFEIHLDRAVFTAKSDGLSHALLYIDLDQFKIVNDTCGHRAGDDLLIRISGLLDNGIRRSDIVARLGGDEFGILLHRCSMSQARRIADNLRRSARETRFAWEEKIFEIGLSIGIVEINANSADPSQLMRAADIACYTAKDLGRDRVHAYQESDSEMRRRHDEMQWLARITRALEEDRLVLYAQEMRPVTHSGDPVKRLEILLRMFDEDGTIVPAQTFLSAAERYNLIPTIDRWVIRECFDAMRGDPNRDAMFYSINVSGASLSQADFLDYINKQIRNFGINAAHICFEITETAAISHLENACRFVGELKTLGCQFALDDFGSGLSSFGYLRDLSVDYLKIDGSFIQSIATDTVHRALVAAINDVGHVMLIDTIAEYVESTLVLDEIRRIGIDYAQGSLIGEPMPLPSQNAKLERLRARLNGSTNAEAVNRATPELIRKRSARIAT